MCARRLDPAQQRTVSCTQTLLQVTYLAIALGDISPHPQHAKWALITCNCSFSTHMTFPLPSLLLCLKRPTSSSRFWSKNLSK